MCFINSFGLLKLKECLNKSIFFTYPKEQLLHEQPLTILCRMIQIRAARK